MLCDICVGVLQHRRNLISDDKHARFDGQNSKDGTSSGEEKPFGKETSAQEKQETEIRRTMSNAEEGGSESKEPHIETFDESVEEDYSQNSGIDGDRKGSYDGETTVDTGMLETKLQYWYVHHWTVQTLVESAALKCHICQVVWKRVSKKEKESLCASHDTTNSATNVELSQLTNATRRNYEYLTRMEVYGQRWPGATFDAKIYFHLQALPLRHQADAFLLRPVDEPVCEPVSEDTQSSTYTSSEESLQTAVWWLQDCLRNHEACNREKVSSLNAPWHPTRLLYHGESGGIVQLILTAEKPPIGPYTTLSHRWGTAQFIKLLRSNISAFHSGIAVTKLPKTFQEAIIISRRLGAQYIWIDSLCIMQDKDDLSDWLHEAALMSKVYSHSYCNISASDTEDNLEGLFRSRDAHQIRPTSVKLCVEGLHAISKYIDCKVEHDDYWKTNVEECLIQKRGWVFQERLLAPRVLHCGHYQLFWECRQKTACETYPHPFPHRIRYSSFKFNLDVVVQRDSDPDIMDSCSYIWGRLVEAYAQTTVTCATDKLIAISGIAKYFSGITGDTYIAGMWRKDLEGQLLWWCFDDDDTRKEDLQVHSRPSCYRAPTWSWASLDRSVVWDSAARDMLITVRDVVLTYATDDVTGLVTGGWLDLQGLLKPMSLLQEDKTQGGKEENIWIILDGHTEAFLSDSTAVNLDIPQFDSSKFDMDNAQQSLFYMPACDHEYYWSVKYLLLRVIDPSQGLFERIGIGCCLTQEDVDTVLDKSMPEEERKRLPCLRYNEDGTHTIRII